MDRQMQTKVRNMPSEPISGYVVARLVCGELWYYGTWDNYESAVNVADEFENGLVLAIMYVAEGEQG